MPFFSGYIQVAVFCSFMKLEMNDFKPTCPCLCGNQGYDRNECFRILFIIRTKVMPQESTPDGKRYYTVETGKEQATHQIGTPCKSARISSLKSNLDM